MIVADAKLHSDSFNKIDRLVVAAAADHNYALPLAVMLRSAADHLRPGAMIEAHVVDDGLSATERESVETSMPGNVDLHWAVRPGGEFNGLPNWGRMSLTTYHKLTLSEWLPDRVGKVLWLDADLLVLADLAPLWETELNDLIARAALDPGVPDVSSRFGIAAYEELGLPPQTKYFNAGVMLLDLSRWRAEKVARRALEYLRRYRQQVFFWDQEALNAVLAGRWGTLEPRWNWMPRFDRLTSREEKRDPWIIHFSGNLKPWTYKGSTPHHILYYQWLDKTFWRGWRPPMNWRGRASAAYESSHLRQLLYPLEQFHLRLVRRLTRR